MNITANLDAALGALWYSDRQRVLWIDAVCINQDDLQEQKEPPKKIGVKTKHNTN